MTDDALIAALRQAGYVVVPVEVAEKATPLLDELLEAMADLLRYLKRHGTPEMEQSSQRQDLLQQDAAWKALAAALKGDGRGG